MNASIPPPWSHNSPDLVPAPVFQLGTALAWLGHTCPNYCSAPIDELSASVWVVRRGPVRRTSLEGKIVVDITGTPEVAAATRKAIQRVNSCAAADGIYVYGRRRNRGGRALTLLDPTLA